MIIHSFTFIKLWPGGDRPSRMTVNVSYNPVNREVTALYSNGGIPPVTYDSAIPDLAAGALIFSTTEGTDVIRVFYQKNYPFGYLEVETDPDIPAPILVINSILVTPQTQVGLNDGTAIILVSGGTLPYQYSLNGVDYQSSNEFLDLPPGNYTAFVKSVSNPAVTTQVFVIERAPDEPVVETPALKDVIAKSGGEISIQNAYKRVEVLSEFGKVPSALNNGDFEKWDGQNFESWTRFGGVNFTRIQRTVKSSSGALVPIQNYAVQFNTNAVDGKFLRHDPINVSAGDTLKFSYNVSKTDTMITVPGTGSTSGGVRPDRGGGTFISTFYIFKARIRVGSFYLYNQDYGNGYEWVNSLTVVGNQIDNRSGDISNFSSNFSAPECPVSGELVIDIFGFEKVQQKKYRSLTGDGFIYDPFEVIPMTTPVSMDNFFMSKSSKSKDNDVTGILSVSESLAYYTEKPDLIKIMFGDYFLSSASLNPMGTLYAMRFGDAYTTGWYEYGTTASPIAFGLALAKSILRAYQKPFRFWLGDLILKPLAAEFNYLNTFNFDVPGQPKFNGKVFSILGGDIDLKYNTISNVKLAEIFDRPGKSNDITIPSYPDTTPPIFVQDPNGDTDLVGVFTDEFTQEFT